MRGGQRPCNLAGDNCKDTQDFGQL